MTDNIVALPTFGRIAEDLAKECHATYQAFRAKGFTDEQAFELLKWVLSTD